MKNAMGKILWWFEHRLELRKTLWPMMRHPIPRGLRTQVGWLYVFGSTAMTLFALQIVTGIGLGMVYVPSAGEAYESLQHINYEVELGWMLRAIHNWSATGMVVLVVVHMAQVFLMGAYKYPRELTWIVGVLLFLLTLGMAFTGQVLRWDADSYWGLGVGAAMIGRIPLIGPELVELMLGGPTVGATTLSRFFALHVFIIPGLLFSALGIHLYLVLRKGISEPPNPDEPVDPGTYEENYEQKLKTGDPFFPDVFLRDAVFIGLTLLVVVGLSAVLGPDGPGVPPDPTLIEVEPLPDWYFLPAFAALALSPPSLETGIILIAPVVIVAVLFLIPIFGGKGQRSPRRRPVAVLSVVICLLAYGVLWLLGVQEPWSPHMTAWSGEPVPTRMIEHLSPKELQGAAILQQKTCRNCHALDGRGGQRGPDLTAVATRLTHDQMIRQVIQGGGNMPAYGKELNRFEVEALVAFLDTLKPEGYAAAQSSVVTDRDD
jgi:ubiquinol-cytochrome c reductase cytochrome b subunit